MPISIIAFLSGTMALKFPTMMKMSKIDLIAMAHDLDMNYPTTFAPDKFQICMDIPAHIAKFKNEECITKSHMKAVLAENYDMQLELEDVLADMGHR